MSYVIHKYTLDVLEIGKVQTIEMSADATIVSFQNQNNSPVIWVLESPDRPRVPVPLALAMTGERVPGGREEAEQRYLGTAQFENGRFVLHLFSME